MDIVECPFCRVRVALSAEGVCPSCRRKPSSASAEGHPDRSAELRLADRPLRALPENPPGSLEEAIGQIEETLHTGRLPPTCCQCDASAESVCDVHVEHDDVRLLLPARVCPRCARKVPFVVQESDSGVGFLPFILLWLFAFWLAAQYWLAMACLAAALALFLVWLLRRSAARDRRPVPLPEVLSRVVAYRGLLQAAPGAVLVPVRGSYRAVADATDMASRFARSVEFHRTTAYLVSEAELARSLMPPAVGRALTEMVSNAIVGFVRQFAPRCGLVVQVVCAVLPGKRNAFEIQGLPLEMTARLLRRLSALPSWPVAYPFLFVIQRQIPGEPVSVPAPIEQPLITWWRLVGRGEAISYAEIACRFHGIESFKRSVEVTLSDIEALRAQLPNCADLAVLYAELLAAAGRHTESLALYDALVENHPGEKHFRLLRVSCLESADQPERAAAECQAILKECPNDATTRGYLAHLQLKMGRPADAIRTVSEAIACEEQPRLYVVRAQACAALGQFKQALADVNIALFGDANTASAYLLRARLYLRSRRFEQALADIDQYHRTAGPSVDSVSLQATALRAHEGPEAAARRLSTAMQEGLDHPIVRLQRADCLGESGKLEMALEDCNAVIEQYPDSAVAYVVRASILFESGRHEAALRDAERGIELGAEDSRAFLVLGLAKAAAGDLERAAEFLGRAVELDPENMGAMFHRARLQSLLGNDEAAIHDLSAVIRCYPDWGEAFVQRGFLQLKTERLEAALEDFESALRVAPHMAEAYRGRAAARVVQGNKAAAMADLDKAVMLEPDNIACRLARTHLLLWDDDRQGAKADLDAALRISPNLIAALFQRAQLYLSLGEHGAARRDFDAILAQSPDAAFAFIGRSVAWEQAGNLEQSEKDLGEAAQAAPQEAQRLEVLRLVLNATAAHGSAQFDKAVTYATEAIEIDPESVQAYRIRAAAYWYSEQFVEAVDDYSHVIASAEEADSGCYNGRGQLYAELGEFDRAFEDLDRAVALAREKDTLAGLAYSLNGRGRALTGLGRYAEAERDFAESLRLKPENAWLHFNRGLLYLATGHPEEAATCFDLSLHVANPPLSPRKQARARGFLAKAAPSPAAE